MKIWDMCGKGDPENGDEPVKVDPRPAGPNR